MKPFSVGLFTRGRASKPYHRRGRTSCRVQLLNAAEIRAVPDLTFSNIKLDKMPRRGPRARHGDGRRDRRHRQDRAFDKDEGISRFFAATKPAELEPARPRGIRTRDPRLLSTNSGDIHSTPSESSTLDPSRLGFLGFGAPGPRSSVPARARRPDHSSTRSISWSPGPSVDEQIRRGMKSKAAQSTRRLRVTSSDRGSDEASSTSGSSIHNAGHRPTVANNSGRNKVHGDRSTLVHAPTHSKRKLFPTSSPEADNASTPSVQPIRAMDPGGSYQDFKTDLKCFFNRWKDKVKDPKDFDQLLRVEKRREIISDQESSPPLGHSTMQPAQAVSVRSSPGSKAPRKPAARIRELLSDSSSDFSSAPSRGPYACGALDDDRDTQDRRPSKSQQEVPFTQRGQPVMATAAPPLAAAFISLHYSDTHPMHGVTPLYEAQMGPAGLADPAVAAPAHSNNAIWHGLPAVVGSLDRRGDQIGRMEDRRVHPRSPLMEARDIDTNRRQAHGQLWKGQQLEIEPESPGGSDVQRRPVSVDNDRPGSSGRSLFRKHTTSELESLQDSLVRSKAWGPEIRSGEPCPVEPHTWSPHDVRAPGGPARKNELRATHRAVSGKDSLTNFWQPNILY